MNEDIIDLQIRMTHQESHIQELDRIIYRQQQIIDILMQKVELLQTQLRTVTESNILNPAEDKPPPHY